MANFFKKKKWIVFLASLTMGLCMVFGAGCKEKVEKISITKSNSPQAVYVVGSDLDFSEGKLTVVIDGEKSEVPLNDSEVSVTGYDKNKLGEQVLTIAYKEQTTIFKVTVVPRMVAENYESAYFVGEPLNLESGSVVITADDGKTSSVRLSESTITVSGYDSSAANAALPLTVTYQNGETRYETTFNVAIYAVDTVEFKSPNKKAYQNHETVLDVSGGYMTLKCENLSRSIPVTKDMVSGFDLSAATVEHRENPLMQTLTVSYYGHQKTYDIQIKFSNISFIELRASEMANLTWTGCEMPSECTETMGENALEAMEVFFEMSNAETTQLSNGAIEHIARVATAYGLDKWQKAFALYSDAFYLNDDGTLSWNCEDFDKTAAAYQNILDRDPVLYEDGAILVKIAEEFAETVLYKDEEAEEEYLIGSVLSVMYSPDTIDEFTQQLALIISLHNEMKVVPTEWTLDMLKSTYAETMQNVWVLLRETEFKATAHRPLYLLVSRWREKNDYFEILYTYYYSEDISKINDFKDLRLPSELETLYSQLLVVRNQIIMTQQLQALEVTNLMVTYEAALQQRDKILASGDQMLIDLYETLEFDYLIGNGEGGYAQVSFDALFSQFRRTSYGYMYNFNTYLGVNSYEALWADYSAVIQKAGTTENYLESEQFGEDVQRLMRAYWSLSPKQQFGFMNILNPYYKPSAVGRYPLYAWENDGNGFNNQFAFLVYTYYEGVLPESTHEIFTEMMLAAEGLANLSLTAPITTFLEHMGNVDRLKTRLMEKNPEDWETFNNIAGWMLLDMESLQEKFAGLAEEGGTVKQENLTQAELEDFENLLNATYEAYNMMVLYSGQSRFAVAFYAAMEKVEYYSKKILSSDNPNVLRAYSFDEFILENVQVAYFQEMENGRYNVAWMPFNFGGTMDYLVYFVRSEYIRALTSTSYLRNDYLMYDAYQDMKVQSFMDDASYLFSTYLYMNLLPSEDAEYKYYQDVDAVVSLMDDFRNTLTDEQRYFVLVLDGGYSMYHNSIIRFGKEINTQITSLVEQLIKVERTYIFYKQMPDGEADGEKYIDMLKTEYELLLSDYAQLQKDVEEEANKEKPNQDLVNAIEDFGTYFGNMYNDYIAKCAAIDFPTNA